ncbi:hypothetical protein G5V59_10115 [Nocardioides sp. W3-2-3]|uniref:hypothetical protein n=1 Tax=Nocardioides convexus TaxID=2712224 RepID=UPI0024183D8B|nr:hypothetical protein [Nocardioides convexus]NHA00345.1 hypothetical protein [Nocardioides convexus]
MSAVAAAALLAGCGPTDDAPEPGVAASVQGESVRLSRVDDTVAAFCSLLATEDGAPVYAKASVRSQAGVELGAGDRGREARRQVRRHAALRHDRPRPGEALLEHRQRCRRRGLRLLRVADLDPGCGSATRCSRSATRSLVAQTGQPGSQDAALAAGTQVVDTWLDGHDVHLNPSLGTRDPKQNGFLGDDLSVAVSGAARQGNEPRPVDGPAGRPAARRPALRRRERPAGTARRMSPRTARR